MKPVAHGLLKHTKFKHLYSIPFFGLFIGYYSVKDYIIDFYKE